MSQATILEDGDAVEKATWPALAPFFPHYEEFWRFHLVPLRTTGSIHPRRGIDEDFEFLAMQHYSLYVTLGYAYERILGNQASASIAFPDDIYALLQRVGELAQKVVQRFEQLFYECLREKADVDTLGLRKLVDRIDSYRNLIHQEFLAVQCDASGRIFVPKPEKLERYRKWTDVLYHAREEDFVDVHKQLIDDFRALCSGLETTWKILCQHSVRLHASKTYLKKQGRGESVPLVSFTVPPASGTFMIRTSAVSSAVATPTVGAVLIRKPGE